MTKILNSKEVAEHLRLSVMQVRIMCRKGIIPAYKEGRKGGFRIKEEDVEAYIQKRYEEC